VVAQTTAAAVATAAKPAGKPAPDLGNLQWHNAAPLSLGELRGKTVLLVFWSTI
jgi:hypothetical protein